MKTYEQLTSDEQAKAVNTCVDDLLTAILEGLRFNDALNEDNLQARIDAARAKAKKMQTPWFAHEYILDTCREDLTGIARCDAEDAMYAEPGETILRGIAGR